MSRGAAYGRKAAFYLTYNKHGRLFNAKKDALRYAFQVSLLTEQSLHKPQNLKEKGERNRHVLQFPETGQGRQHDPEEQSYRTRDGEIPLQGRVCDRRIR